MAALNEGITRHRISILAFDEVKALWQAALDLSHNGFSAAQFCLFGQSRILATLDPPPRVCSDLERELESLFSCLPARVKLASGDILGMRCGRLAETLFDCNEPGIMNATWMRPDLARGLAQEVTMGCIVLLVTSSTAHQHALGARLLLRHGTRDLQTHEFSVDRY